MFFYYYFEYLRQQAASLDIHKPFNKLNVYEHNPLAFANFFLKKTTPSSWKWLWAKYGLPVSWITHEWHLKKESSRRKKRSHSSREKDEHRKLKGCFFIFQSSSWQWSKFSGHRIHNLYAFNLYPCKINWPSTKWEHGGEKGLDQVKSVVRLRIMTRLRNDFSRFLRIKPIKKNPSLSSICHAQWIFIHTQWW